MIIHLIESFICVEASTGAGRCQRKSTTFTLIHRSNQNRGSNEWPLNIHKTTLREHWGVKFIAALVGVVALPFLINVTSNALDPHYAPPLVRWGWFGFVVYCTAFSLLFTKVRSIASTPWHKYDRKWIWRGSRIAIAISYLIILHVGIDAACARLLWRRPDPTGAASSPPPKPTQDGPNEKAHAFPPKTESPTIPTINPPLRQYRDLVFVGFKDSPEFTFVRREFIEDAMERFYQYMIAAGYHPAKEVPMIGCNPGKGYGSGGAFPGPAYRNSIYLGVRDLQKRQNIMLAYASYSLPVMLDAYSVRSKSIAESSRRWECAQVMAYYLVSDLYEVPVTTDAALADAVPRWLPALWEVRLQCGSGFLNRSIHWMSISLKDWQLEDTNTSNSSSDTDRYFYGRLFDAMTIEDNDNHKRQAAVSLLQARRLDGIPVPLKEQVK